MANSSVTEQAIALLIAYTESLQEIANQAWAHVPEEGDIIGNFKALFDQIDADFETFKSGLIFVCRTGAAYDAIRRFEWKVEREP